MGSCECIIGLSLTCALRSLGQQKSSQHARGQAADFECHTVDNKQLFEWVTNELDFDQAILEFYTGTPESGWLHVSYNKDGNRKQKLRAFRTMPVRLNTKRSSNEK